METQILKKHNNKYYGFNYGNYIVREFSSEKQAVDWIKYVQKNGHNFTSLSMISKYVVLNSKITEDNIDNILKKEFYSNQ